MSRLVARVKGLIPLAVPVRITDSDDEVVMVGPPGTGKTTALSTLVRAHLEAGVVPERIGLFSFTRNAAQEIRERLSDLVSAEDMPWCSTIHSACFRLLSLRRDQTMQTQHFNEMGRSSGWSFSGGRRDPDDPYSGGGLQTFGDWLLAAEELRRARCISHEEAVDTFWVPAVGSGWNVAIAERFTQAKADYKRQTDMVEFADMLERVLRDQLRPPVSHLFLDEAQDCSPLQFQVIDLWAQGVKRLFMFGDPRQAIYVFGGADPRLIEERPGHRLVLSQSFRLPVDVHAEAQRLASRMRDQIPQEFASTGKEGKVDQAYSWDEALGGLNGKRTFILSRNKWFLQDARELLTDQVIPFQDRTSKAGVPSPGSAQARAIGAALDLNEGKLVATRTQLRTLRNSLRDDRLWPEDRIPTGGMYKLQDLLDYGAEPRLLEMLAISPLSVLRVDDYCRELIRRRGRKVLEERAGVELSSIHGAKGEEAEQVIVCVNMTNATYGGYLREPSEEHRVVYVGCTRAKRELCWLTLPDSGGRYYEL